MAAPADAENVTTGLTNAQFIIHQQFETEVNNRLAGAANELQSLWRFPTIWGVRFGGVDGVPNGLETRARRVIALQFLRAANFDKQQAIEMLDSTLGWRESKQIRRNPLDEADQVLPENPLGLRDIIFQRGVDRENRTVVYLHFNVLNDTHKFQLVFPDGDINPFVDWVAKFVEVAAIKEMARDLNRQKTGLLIVMDSGPTSPYHFNKAITFNKAIKACRAIIKAHYPGLVSEKVLCSADLTKTFKSLDRYIRPHYIPRDYGGFSQADDEPLVRPVHCSLKYGRKRSFRILCTDLLLDREIQWQLRVVTWDVAYAVEFHPGNGDHVQVLQELTTEPPQGKVATGMYTVRNPGSIRISVENKSFSSKEIMIRCLI